jgi:hypothetical protein
MLLEELPRLVVAPNSHQLQQQQSQDAAGADQAEFMHKQCHEP